MSDKRTFAPMVGFLRFVKNCNNSKLQPHRSWDKSAADVGQFDTMNDEELDERIAQAKAQGLPVLEGFPEDDED